MEKRIDIFEDRANDRTIVVLYDKLGAVKSIDFMQGKFDESSVLGATENAFKVNIFMMEIYNRMTLQYSNLPFEERIKRTCELYCIAFIFQEVD